MCCGNKEHLLDMNIAHACGICKYYDIDLLFGKVDKEPCITCKKGDCRFKHE